MKRGRPRGNNSNTPIRCMACGSTTAAKMNGRVGVKMKRLMPGDLTDGRLRKEIAKGFDHFWAKRGGNPAMSGWDLRQHIDEALAKKRRVA